MVNPTIKSLLLVAFVACRGAAAAKADVQVDSLFREGVVLQRGMPLRVWGTAAAGEDIAVSVASRSAKTAAGADGRWEVVFQELKQGGPYELLLEGKNRLSVKNVMVGEVWICSGQSNMRTPLHDRVPGAEELIRAAETPGIRLFDLENREAGWVVSSPSAAPNFPSIPYVFARGLQAALHVPVGIVLTAVNGSAIEPWLHPDTLASLPETRDRFQSAYYGPSVESVSRLSVRGVAWYQGESNSTDLERAKTYHVLLPALIADWRKAWQREDLPFLIVQIAPFHEPSRQPGESPLAAVREAQRQTSLSVRRVALVVNTDVGEVNDIHPHNKVPVGQRLALAARAMVYEHAIEGSGPVLVKAVRGAAGVNLEFSHAAGLTTKSGEVQGFCLAADDRQFKRADARIDAGKVIVSSLAVDRAKYVRFGWADFPIVDLWNEAGLPASPFEATVDEP